MLYWRCARRMYVLMRQEEAHARCCLCARLVTPVHNVVASEDRFAELDGLDGVL